MQLKEAKIVNTVGYRGDTRPPEEIFPNGFHNRQSPEYLWMKILNGGSEDFEPKGDVDVKSDHLSESQTASFNNPAFAKAWDPLKPGQLQYRVWLKSDPKIYIIVEFESVEGLRTDLWEHYAKNLPVYRDKEKDISPKTAVCFTLRGPHVASYFPIEGCTAAGGEWLWIYAVSLGAAYKTYTYQQRDKSPLAAAREVAVEHVSASHVICAIRCWRKGRYPDMDFLLGVRICWNPMASGERLLWKDRISEAFYPYHAMRAKCHDCDVTQKGVKDSARLLLEPAYPYYIWQK